MSEFLEGKNIYLRAFYGTDIPVWHAWFNNSIVTECINKGVYLKTEIVNTFKLCKAILFREIW